MNNTSQQFLSTFSMDDLTYCVSRHIISKSDNRFLLAMRNVHAPNYLQLHLLSTIHTKLKHYSGISQRAKDAKDRVAILNSTMRTARSNMLSLYRITTEEQEQTQNNILSSSQLSNA